MSKVSGTGKSLRQVENIKVIINIGLLIDPITYICARQIWTDLYGGAGQGAFNSIWDELQKEQT